MKLYSLLLFRQMEDQAGKLEVQLDNVIVKNEREIAKLRRLRLLISWCCT